MRQVTLVAGPPCAGKTTWVAARSGPRDLVLDQDVIGAAAMNRALATLATSSSTAWVIRCCAGPTRRAAFAQQIRATDTVLLAPDRNTLIARAARRTNPRRHIAAVDAWLRAELADRPLASRPSTTPKPQVPRSHHRVGHRYRQARKQMFAIYGDLCHLCHHHGASQADHLVPITVWADQPIDPHLMRPAHGNTAGTRCATCGRACNQERGNRTSLDVSGFSTDDF
jgi:5-methylcytosine-specific restriction endonuclease McrA